MQARNLTALITPFDDKGWVDLHLLDQLIHFQIAEKTDGIVLCGSTGEGSLLTREEKIAVFHRAVEKAKGSLEVIANIGSCSTQQSLDLAKEAKRCKVDALMAVVPYYVKPTIDGCVRHFEAIASVGLPLVVYHHPTRTGTRLSLEDLLRIASIEGVVAIKEASGDLNLALELIQNGIPLYSGDDLLCASHLQLGGSGSISICGNVIPHLWREAVQSKTVSSEVEEICRCLVLETNPQCVKYAASVLGLCDCRLRLPLIEPCEVSQRKIRSSLENVGLVFH